MPNKVGELSAGAAITISPNCGGVWLVLGLGGHDHRVSYDDNQKSEKSTTGCVCGALANSFRCLSIQLHRVGRKMSVGISLTNKIVKCS